MTGAANIKGGTPNHATEITVSGCTIIRRTVQQDLKKIARRFSFLEIILVAISIVLIAAAMTGWWWCMLDFNRRLLELKRGVFELKVDMVDRRLLEIVGCWN
jgi:hypothetical protein